MSHAFPLINSKNFVAEPLENNEGYTWTLTTRLGQMLREAEGRFGKRDRSYTILGIEFADDGPQLWFPGNCQHVAVQLSTDCLSDTARACYQLAHEVIHLLSPTGARNATNLEEGLATCFAEDYMREHFSGAWTPILPSYEAAGVAARSLLNKNPEVIKEIRIQELVISRIVPELLLSGCPALGGDVAAYLCQPFIR